MTEHTCAGRMKKFDLRSGSQRGRHSLGFFNVPVQAPILYGYSEKPPKSPFTTRWGYGGHILDSTPGSSRGCNVGSPVMLEAQTSVSIRGCNVRSPVMLEPKTSVSIFLSFYFIISMPFPLIFSKIKKKTNMNPPPR